MRRCGAGRVILLLLVLLLVPLLASGAQAGGEAQAEASGADGAPVHGQRAEPAAPARRPSYQDRRFDEDWSALARPEALASQDLFDAVKAVPLGEDVWLSLGGQVRERLEIWSGYEFGAPRDDDETFLLSRFRVHADLRVGSHLRGFLELQSALSTDTGAFDGARGRDTDTFDVLNGFVELGVPLGGGGSGGEPASGRALTLRVGRQELRFGRQRLVSPLDWANARRTFDGASLELAAGGFEVTAFATRPVRVRPYQWDDPVHGSAFYGVHATGALPGATLGWARLDLYAYGLHRSDVSLEGTTGDERRATLGARISGPLPETRFDVDLEAAWQGGRAGGHDISAWMVASQLGWWLSQHRLSPRFFLGFDAASGDGRPGGGVQLFDHLFPLGHAYFGAADVVGRQNVLSPSVGVSFRPFVAVTAELAFHEFWREDADSGLYDAAGRLLRAGGLSSSRHVGAEIDALVKWQLDPHTQLLLGYSHVFPGGFIDRSGPSDPIDFTYLIAQYTF